MIRFWSGIFLAWMVITAGSSSALAQDKVPAKRRVFVLHAGMHIIFAPADKNHAPRKMKETLKKRGIPESDIIALDSPFPTATWSDVVPREGLLIYLGSGDPASRVSHENYERLHKVLQERKVTRDDHIVWIGHSAGGQMGMTLAHLAHNLHKYPDLAKKTQPYCFEMVITLGSAVGSNPVPTDVKLRHYHSSADTMIASLSKHGDLVASSVGIPFPFRPFHDLRANATVRIFQGIEHPSWYMEPRVLDCIQREFDPNARPAWQQTPTDVHRGVGLAQLLAKSLESECRLCLEEP